VTRWEAIALLVVLFALGISSRWWGPLLDAYGRGLLVGLMSGVLLGQMFERRRQRVQTQRDERLSTKLEQLTARLERSVP
jgi:hypothetical protein